MIWAETREALHIRKIIPVTKVKSSLKYLFVPIYITLPTEDDIMCRKDEVCGEFFGSVYVDEKSFLMIVIERIKRVVLSCQ
jgi:hypothetical protein